MLKCCDVHFRESYSPSSAASVSCAVVGLLELVVADTTTYAHCDFLAMPTSADTDEVDVVCVVVAGVATVAVVAHAAAV